MCGTDALLQPSATKAPKTDADETTASYGGLLATAPCCNPHPGLDIRLHPPTGQELAQIEHKLIQVGLRAPSNGP